ncbi:hypothetical protein ACLKA6_007089 [Drosophila palustris]
MRGCTSSQLDSPECYFMLKCARHRPTGGGRGSGCDGAFYMRQVNICAFVLSCLLLRPTSQDTSDYRLTIVEGVIW